MAAVKGRVFSVAEGDTGFAAVVTGIKYWAAVADGEIDFIWMFSQKLERFIKGKDFILAVVVIFIQAVAADEFINCPEACCIAVALWYLKPFLRLKLAECRNSGVEIVAGPMAFSGFVKGAAAVGASEDFLCFGFRTGENGDGFFCGENGSYREGCEEFLFLGCYGDGNKAFGAGRNFEVFYKGGVFHVWLPSEIG